VVEKELKDLLGSFGNQLTEAQRNQYIPKLRDYFIRYVLENKKDIKDIESLFKYELTRNDIIKSTKFYVTRNEDVKSKGAIDDFLIALNQFFELEIKEKYFNQNLINLRPFMKLSLEIGYELLNEGVKLKDKESYPAINDNQFNYLIQLIKDDNDNSMTKLQSRIIVKILLLYGFSPGRIISLKVSDFIIEKRSLYINYCENPNRFIKLEIPYSLFNDLLKHSEQRKNTKGFCDNLFITTTGNEITHSYLKYYLGKVKQDYYYKNPYEEIEDVNPFTLTGLAKYAIIKMILNGMNQSIIMDLTGFENDVFEYCQEYVNNIKAISKDRYINSKIRSIDTFDIF